MSSEVLRAIRNCIGHIFRKSCVKLVRIEGETDDKRKREYGML